MKKNCLVILTILSCLCASHAQGLSFDDNVKMAQIDSVMSVIDRREVALNDVKKDKAKVDSLNALAEDYAVLANLWEDRYKDEANVADKYRALFILLSEDDTVFSCGLPDVKLIPVALRGHYDLIKEVISVQKEIGRIEQKIDEKTQACLSLNQDPKTVIPDLISDDIEAVYNKISRIKESGMPTFSNAQKQYFDKNIKDKYNNFEKYFANE